MPLLPALVDLLHWEGPEGEGAVTDACWAFAHMTDTIATSVSPDDESKRLGAVVSCGALKQLVALLWDSREAIVEAAVHAIGNLVSGGDDVTQAAIDVGALPRLIGLTEHGRRGVAKDATWALSNVAAGTHRHIDALLVARGPSDASDPGVSGPTALQASVTLLRVGTPEVRREAVWIIANIASGGAPEHLTALMRPPIVEGLCLQLESPHTETLLATLHALESLLRTSRQRHPPSADGGPSLSPKWSKSAAAATRSTCSRAMKTKRSTRPPAA